MKPLTTLLSVVLGLAAGAGLYTLGTWVFGPDIVPWLGTVLVRLNQMLAQPATWIDLSLTLARTLTGFSLAFVLGVPAGLLLGSVSWSDRLFFLPVVLLQACPPLFWTIPLVLILGTDGWAPIAVVFLVVLPLVILNVREGRRAIAPTLRDVFRVYAPNRWLIARELLLPALGPALKSSLVVGIVLGLKSAVLGEWFGAHTGLGRSIFRLYGFFDMPGFFALVFLFLAVGALAGGGTEVLARWWFPARRSWRPGRIQPMSRSRPADPLVPARVSLQGVGFQWGARPLFRSVNLEIEPGETVVLAGPSGSGKTTLARIALGLLKPNQGVVRSPRRPALLLQGDGLLSHRDVLGNVLLPAWQQRAPQAETRARALLGLVGLAGEEDKFPDELSGGMRQRTALARALMQDPDFFVLDEPFQNLDEPARTALWDLVFNIVAERGLGTLIITHHPQELEGRRVRPWTWLT